MSAQPVNYTTIPVSSSPNKSTLSKKTDNFINLILIASIIVFFGVMGYVITRTGNAQTTGTRADFDENILFKDVEDPDLQYTDSIQQIPQSFNGVAISPDIISEVRVRNAKYEGDAFEKMVINKIASFYIYNHALQQAGVEYPDEVKTIVPDALSVQVDYLETLVRERLVDNTSFAYVMAWTKGSPNAAQAEEFAEGSIEDTAKGLLSKYKSDFEADTVHYQSVMFNGFNDPFLKILNNDAPPEEIKFFTIDDNISSYINIQVDGKVFSDTVLPLNTAETSPVFASSAEDQVYFVVYVSEKKDNEFDSVQAVFDRYNNLLGFE